MSEPVKAKDNPQLDPLEAMRRAEDGRARLLAARSALRKGERERARELLKEVFALLPGNLEAIELLGDVYMAEGETEKAAQLLERALQQHPGHLPFEEKLAVCHLDLAEMENDKLSRELLLQQGDIGKEFEKSPAKAVTLSLFLPGAGQVYNDENEKGAVFLGAAILTCIGWCWPLFTAMSQVVRSTARNNLEFERILPAMSGAQAGLFWIMLMMWMAVYAVSMYDAGTTASRQNLERRRALGL